jgi:hypothetical protein
MLKILIAICGVWTVLVAWAAVSLIGLMTS